MRENFETKQLELLKRGGKPVRIKIRIVKTWPTFLVSFLDFFDSEDADRKSFQIFRNFLPIDMVSNRRRIESSTSPMRESQISHDADR